MQRVFDWSHKAQSLILFVLRVAPEDIVCYLFFINGPKSGHVKHLAG